MDAQRAHQIARRTIHKLARCYGAAILCFFAFVPGWILVHVLIDIFQNPRTVLDASLKDLFLGVGVLIFCAALIYFLLLLAYRAFTNRGRMRDGGLLPPVAMQSFAALFAVGGAAISALGLMRQEVTPVVAGLLQFLSGVAVFRLAGSRRHSSAGPGP